MKLSIETIDVTVTISVPGSYTPDVLDDVANRAVDVFNKAATIMWPTDTDG